MIGSTNLSGGGGVGSDELTATAANVLEETTYVGADTDDELAEGTMQHLSNRATITHTTENATKVIEGDAAFTSTNSDGTARAEIRYNGTEGFITPNTLFAVPQGDMATAGGLTAEKLLQGQSAFGIAGTATSDATGTASQLLSGRILYGKGSKITGTMGDYSGKTSTSNYVSSTFRSATSGYVFASPGSTGYYTTGSYLRIPASNLSAANIKKGVSIMGIIGTWSGFVAEASDVYNRGTWNRYGTNIISMEYGSFDAAEPSALRFKTGFYDYSSYYEAYTTKKASVYLWKNAPINFTPYSKLQITVSGVLGQMNRSGSGIYNTNLIFKLLNPSGGYISNQNFTGTGNQQILTMNLSSINVSGYVYLQLYLYDDNKGISNTSPSYPYIYAIQLS